MGHAPLLAPALVVLALLVPVASTTALQAEYEAGTGRQLRAAHADPDQMEVRVTTFLRDKPVPPAFLGTSHEWHRVSDYSQTPETLQQFASIFKRFGGGPNQSVIVRIGGDSQDSMKAPPTESVWKGLRDLAQAANVRYIIGLPLRHMNVQTCRTMVQQAEQILGPYLLAFELGNEPGLWKKEYVNREEDAAAKRQGYEPYIVRFNEMSRQLQSSDASSNAASNAANNKAGGPVAWLPESANAHNNARSSSSSGNGAAGRRLNAEGASKGGASARGGGLQPQPSPTALAAAGAGAAAVNAVQPTSAAAPIPLPASLAAPAALSTGPAAAAAATDAAKNTKSSPARGRLLLPASSATAAAANTVSLPPAAPAAASVPTAGAPAFPGAADSNRSSTNAQAGAAVVPPGMQGLMTAARAYMQMFRRNVTVHPAASEVPSLPPTTQASSESPQQQQQQQLLGSGLAAPADTPALPVARNTAAPANAAADAAAAPAPGGPPTSQPWGTWVPPNTSSPVLALLPLSPAPVPAGSPEPPGTAAEDKGQGESSPPPTAAAPPPPPPPSPRPRRQRPRRNPAPFPPAPVNETLQCPSPSPLVPPSPAPPVRAPGQPATAVNTVASPSLWPSSNVAPANTRAPTAAAEASPPPPPPPSPPPPSPPRAKPKPSPPPPPPPPPPSSQQQQQQQQQLKFVDYSMPVNNIGAMSLQPPEQKLARSFIGPGWHSLRISPKHLQRFVEFNLAALREVSLHYYALPGEKNVTATLADLHSESRIREAVKNFTTLQSVAAASGLTARITESNSANKGGRQGLSNVFGAALWTADWAFELAYAGASGLNLHWADGGRPPGRPTNKTGPPYAGVRTAFVDGAPNGRPYPNPWPPFYGYMLFADAVHGSDSSFVSSQILRNTCQQNIKVWSVLSADMRQVRVTLINKALTGSRPCQLQVRLEGTTWGPASLNWLLPGQDGQLSKQGVTYRGQTYEGSTDGTIKGAPDVPQLQPWLSSDGLHSVYSLQSLPGSALLLVAHR